jgi:phosphoribosyl-ATP pyrophosphohydrolase/phosphoribosyl-AMP cyclohydrolase
MSNINFSKLGGLAPAIIQHARTRHVLMLGFMNAEAFEATKTSGRVTFFSRSRQSLWTKGETSGHFLEVRDIRVDCDQDTVLVLAEPKGPTCHTGSDTCFGETLNEGSYCVETLEAVIASRKAAPPSSSYTATLFQEGLDRIAQKVGEEGVEVVIAAKNDSDDRLIDESSDLIFHLMVLLAYKGIDMDRVFDRLAQRHTK